MTLTFRHCGTRSGLTLVELLVSISILTVLLATILMTMYSGLLVWERASGYDMKRMETMLALEGLEKEVRNTFPFHAIEFKGSPSGMKFAGIVSGTTDEGRVQRFCEIKYDFDSPAHTLRRQSRIYPFGSAGGDESVEVLSGVEIVKVTYAAIPEKGRSFAVWLESWDNVRKLPAAVRIEFEFSGAGGPARITRTIRLPVRTPEEKKTEGAADDAA
ncbi:MAG: prepilin-type N-terminal cleavage/methylation domain-containing protein [bacterium]